MNLLILPLLLIFWLTGCAHIQKNVEVQCFTKSGNGTATMKADSEHPVLMTNECVFFYQDGKLTRVCNQACSANSTQ